VHLRRNRKGKFRVPPRSRQAHLGRRAEQPHNQPIVLTNVSCNAGAVLTSPKRSHSPSPSHLDAWRYVSSTPDASYKLVVFAVAKAPIMVLHPCSRYQKPGASAMDRGADNRIREVVNDWRRSQNPVPTSNSNKFWATSSTFTINGCAPAIEYSIPISLSSSCRTCDHICEDAVGRNGS
jgi:hypothetical protein